MAPETETAATPEDSPSTLNIEDAPQIKAKAGRQRPRITLDELVSYYAACGRCGYFLAGYRSAEGLANLETAVAKEKSGWIVLNWDQAVQELVLKSYGSHIENNDFHFEGCCPECRRHFIYRAGGSPNHPDTFRIEIKPRKRQ